jgi:hypothetical protein
MLDRPAKIVSGGQTGVDRAALDAAISLGIEHGGWCPRGRLAEDGPIPPEYRLKETASPDYPVRTERNVLDSDATLILYRDALSGGTELTYRLAAQHKKPVFAVDLEQRLQYKKIRQWMVDNRVKVLNVAGPRESQNPGIAAKSEAFLKKLFK